MLVRPLPSYKRNAEWTWTNHFIDFIHVKGNLFPSHLFDPKKTNQHYRYMKGWNVQALIAYLIGISLPFPGFVATLGATGVSAGGLHLFDLGWLLSFATSFVTYVVICYFWPTPNQKLIREQGLGWEQNAKTSLLVGSEDDEESSPVRMLEGELEAKTISKVQETDF